MGKPGKPIAKNSNSKFTTRNNKQDIFAGIAKSSKAKMETDKRMMNVSKDDTDKPVS